MSGPADVLAGDGRTVPARAPHEVTVARLGGSAYHRVVFDRSPRDPRRPTRNLSANRARFAQLVSQPDPLIDLAEACACIATESNPYPGAPALLDALDMLAERVRERLPEALRAAARPDAGIRTPAELTLILSWMHDLLYGELGLHGASRDVWEPRHTYLLDVLELRRGLPIALSVLELEVGWRLGLPLFGIGLPGHFIVGGPDGLLLDPYNGGRRISVDDCEGLMRTATGRPIEFRRSMLRPASRREILARLLGNLRGIFLSRREWGRALSTLELLVILDPVDPGLRRDRALLYGRCGRFTDAVRGLDRYLEEVPDAEDADDVRMARGIFGGRRN